MSKSLCAYIVCKGDLSRACQLPGLSMLIRVGLVGAEAPKPWWICLDLLPGRCDWARMQTGMALQQLV